jgi:hypothetical protein
MTDERPPGWFEQKPAPANDHSIGVPTYDELMAAKNRYHEDANRYLIQLGRAEEELAAVLARIDRLTGSAAAEALRVEILRQLEHVAVVDEAGIAIDCAGGYASLDVEKLASAVLKEIRNA